MKLVLAFAVLLVAVAGIACAADSAPKVGDKAPDFKLKGPGGQPISL